eukprot:TRINITY_DN31868_c0_g1_i1.p1 TRINITY_DN31868_c0_g1~~TRINITY_DN31868_c0_g1_i1.p1  ORF type:complete len:342 (+),score=96.61 TRINITY_DN31868_c0_g1_i1:85-1110(+)
MASIALCRSMLLRRQPAANMRSGWRVPVSTSSSSAGRTSTASKGNSWRRFFCAQAEAAEGGSSERPSGRILMKHFVTCAVPMIGFGIMDNSILIRAGDAIDNSLGEQFNLTGLECAACGQVLSDFSGVVFGGVIESISRKFILPPSLSASQHAMRITQFTGTAGAAIGVVIGCVIGMGNLLIMDLKEAERQKQLAEMQVLFNSVLKSALKGFESEYGSIFVVDDAKNEVWSFGATGIDTTIRVPISENSLVGWTVVKKQPLNIKDAYQDSRFNRETDKKTGRTTKSVLAIPVYSQSNEEKVIAVIQLMNKKNGYDNVDIRMGKMIAEHTSIFLSELLEGKD